MGPMLPIITITIGILVVFGVFAVAWAIDQRRAQARTILERLASVQQASERSESEELVLLRDELLSDIPILNTLLSKSARVNRLQHFLLQADMQMRAGKFLMVSAACGAVIGLFGEFMMRSLIFTILFAAGGALLPFVFASFKRTRRFHKFEALFPEAIDLLARAVRAGHAFPTALEMIGAETSEPLAGEFRKLFEEQKFGLPMRDALMNLAERMPIMDVKFFVTAVMLQRETGGNLAEILDKLSYVIRERFKILRQVRVFTAQGRLTMALLMGLPPLVLCVMYLMNREFIEVLWKDRIGHVLLAIGVVLQVFGYFMIRRIINIKV